MIKKNESVCAVVEALGTNGEGIIRHEGVTFFVPYSLPQEKIRFKVMKIKKLSEFLENLIKKPIYRLLKIQD